MYPNVCSDSGLKYCISFIHDANTSTTAWSDFFYWLYNFENVGNFLIVNRKNTIDAGMYILENLTGIRLHDFTTKLGVLLKNSGQTVWPKPHKAKHLALNRVPT